MFSLMKALSARSQRKRQEAVKIAELEALCRRAAQEQSFACEQTIAAASGLRAAVKLQSARREETTLVLHSFLVVNGAPVPQPKDQEAQPLPLRKTQPLKPIQGMQSA